MHCVCLFHVLCEPLSPFWTGLVPQNELLFMQDIQLAVISAKYYRNEKRIIE